MGQIFDQQLLYGIAGTRVESHPHSFQEQDKILRTKNHATGLLVSSLQEENAVCVNTHIVAEEDPTIPGTANPTARSISNRAK